MSLPDAAPAGFEPETLVGATLDGRYLLSSHLATGGMGAVFRGQHVYMRKEVAVKVLRPDLSASADLVERFRREAQIAASLEHDNIVRVTDFGRSPEGWLFLVMELLHGESLFDRLRRERFLAPEDLVPILWQVCAALDAAHEMGVVHRDLKPENVFLARTASGREVTKILDFGIAKFADPSSGGSTQAGIVVGTPEYLAPEQALGGKVDGRADLYAVGLIAWRALAGRHPFTWEEPRQLLMMQASRPVPPITEVRPDLAELPGLVQAIARACAKEPADRFPSAAALQGALQAALGARFLMPPGATPAPDGMLRSPRPRATGATALAVAPATTAAGGAASTLDLEPGGAPRPPAGEAVPGVRRGRRRLAGAAIAAALATAAVAAALLLRSDPSPPPPPPRPGAAAAALLEAGKVAEAREAIAAGLARHEGDPELLLLLGHALHRTPGRAAEGIEAYARALDRGPLDAAALSNLAGHLGAEPAVADRAARVLVRAGAPALPVILEAASSGSGARRLRALVLARDLGAEEKLDRVKAYGALLADADCELRKAAARRLGEIGDRAALPRLREAAASRKETRGFFGQVKATPACGAAEAAEAVRKLEAARTRKAR